jgi:zinc transport system substrate-binding protein
MKKIITILLILILIVAGIILIATNSSNRTKNESGKPQIIVTLFPEYDFVKQIAGDKVDVSILLPPGTEVHTYEPTPQDRMNIEDADMFVYTGENMEPWAETIINSISANVYILDVSNNIELIELEDHHDHAGHSEEADPHIWLDPINAVIMCNNITEALCSIDAENADYYRTNRDKYVQELKRLDNDIQTVIMESTKKRVAFGGEFAYAYFVKRYNLSYISAYDACGEGAEPSVSKIKDVIDYINEYELPVIFYQELSQGNIAKTIAGETNAKALIFNTCHNVTKEEMNNGVTYIQLMRQNLENLKTAL